MSVRENKEYIGWIGELKSLIASAQIKAAISVNKELLRLYWGIGQSISNKIAHTEWGSGIVEKLAIDLKKEFPNQKGFSRSNLFAMKKWFEFYDDKIEDIEFVQQLVGQIPWGQNLLVVSKAESIDEAFFYIEKTVTNNWSRSVLLHQMELGLFQRNGKAITNFKETLPELHSELAIETLKDPYKFDFLTLQEKAVEKDIEDQLVKHITSFLLELGVGFSFLGQQVPIKIEDKDFFVDLLFYHIKLRCYVVVELKAIEFKAEFAGKLNFYLSAIDDKLKTKDDNPTIGLLLCKSKSEIIAEYALRGMSQPIGIAEYELVNAIKNIQSELPSIEEIETATSQVLKEEQAKYYAKNN